MIQGITNVPFWHVFTQVFHFGTLCHFQLFPLPESDIVNITTPRENRHMNFADSLKELRNKKGLSQQQLADLVFVDRSSVARWESGARMPDAIMIARLSKCLDVDVDELLRGSEEEKNLVVILVDNEKIILTGSLPVLEKALPGASISGFTKSSEALEYARNTPVDLAFLDIEMGKRSGLTVCQELLDINPKTNVVFLTAYEGYSLDAWKTGASGFLMKPLTVEAVQKQLPFLRNKIKGLTGE